ncbi:MAG TPA: hypothetical protein VD970_10850 [Acetobacteraceae bacterium]|nr:hypothetical protein [Acetobacteraceae bacterium]
MKFSRTIAGRVVTVVGGTRGATVDVDGREFLTLPDREALAWLLKSLGLCHQAVVADERHAYAQERGRAA